MIRTIGRRVDGRRPHGAIRIEANLLWAPWNMLRIVLRVVALALFITIGLPCVFYGSLGLRGRLSDTSVLENLQQGLFFLSVAFLTVLPGLLSFLPIGSNKKRGENRSSQS